MDHHPNIQTTLSNCFGILNKYIS